MAFEGISLAALPFTEDARADPHSGRDSAAAVASLVQTYSPLLFRVANSILSRPAETEDLVLDIEVVMEVVK